MDGPEIALIGLTLSFAAFGVVGGAWASGQRRPSTQRRVPFTVVQYNLFDQPACMGVPVPDGCLGLLKETGQRPRMAHVGAALAAHEATRAMDVLCISEGDVEADMRVLEAGLRTAFAPGDPLARHWTVSRPTRAVGAGIKGIMNGGVRIATKHIVRCLRQYVYETAAKGQADVLSAKGVLLARIETRDPRTGLGTGHVFNVLATHLQAWSDPASVDARKAQAAELSSFVAMQRYVDEAGDVHAGLPPGEPIIIAGDFNVDLVAQPGEVEALCTALNVRAPVEYLFRTADGGRLDLSSPRTQLFTSDPSTNTLVGADGGDADCDDLYNGSTRSPCTANLQRLPCRDCSPAWEAFVAATFFDRAGKLRSQGGKNTECFCPCCGHSWFDYVLVKKDNGGGGEALLPASLTLHAVALKAAAPLRFRLGDCVFGTPDACGAMGATRDLSDHYPVVARMEFEFPPGRPRRLLGACKSEDDPLATSSAQCRAGGVGDLSCLCEGCAGPATCPLNRSCHLTTDIQGDVARGQPLKPLCAAGFTQKSNLNAC